MAIAHEWVSARAGSEKVFESLAKAFPEADLYCLTRDPSVELATGPITTTVLDRPGLRGRNGLLLPFMPMAWRTLRRPSYDVVLTSSHAFARYFADPRDGVHLSYTYTPLRTAWFPEVDGRATAAGPLRVPALAALKRFDHRSVRWTDHWAAISAVVAQRLRSVYGVDPVIIHPPVELHRFTSEEPRPGYVVALSRFIEYKRLDLAVEAADLVGVPIKVLGNGVVTSSLERAAAQALVPVEIITSPSDEEVARTLAGADALIFPAKEDFGIVPVEAQAAGTPVVAVRGFGADDTVIPGVTGELVDGQTADALAGGLKTVLSRPRDSGACRENASQFSEELFHQKIRAWVEEAAAELATRST